jgi:endonuclease/exonuclease/phosphatase (EEP) superfamily protein YafD
VKLVNLVTIAYALGVYGLLLLRETIGEANTPLGMIYSRLDWFLTPALVLLPLLLLLKRPRLALVMAPLVGLWGLHSLPLLLPKPIPAAPADAQALTAMTYNMHVERVHLEPMLAVIRAADADVVALQELSIEGGQAIEAQLSALYPYRALHTLEWAYHGRGLLSKYPILEDRAWPDEQPITVRLQRTLIDVNGQPVVIYNFHAPPQRPIFGQPPDIGPRNQQHADLLALMRAERDPVLMLCDCNITDQNSAYRNLLAAGFQDTFRLAGQGFGLTNPDAFYPQAQEGMWLPLYQRIDFIFASPAFTVQAAQVWPDSGGSDHRPVWARVGMRAAY